MKNKMEYTAHSYEGGGRPIHVWNMESVKQIEMDSVGLDTGKGNVCKIDNSQAEKRMSPR